MSWATCYSGSNNIHFDSPPIMADGRVFASWQPEATVNAMIQKQENITSSWAYRQFLTNNATQIMKYNNQEACSELGLPSHFSTNATPSSNVPFQFNSVMDTRAPGYGYQTSDLKNPYLSREQLQARMISPAVHYKTSDIEPYK
jgi:hypothetical protein